VTKDFSQFWLTRKQLNRLVERTQHFSRCARIVASDEVVNGVAVGKRCARELDPTGHLAPRPAAASGQPTTTALDNLVAIEFNGWSGVEALLDFEPEGREFESLWARQFRKIQRRHSF
jgi:hypothetical protein